MKKLIILPFFYTFVIFFCIFNMKLCLDKKECTVFLNHLLQNVLILITKCKKSISKMKFKEYALRKLTYKFVGKVFGI